jgi:hypothetical protein
LVLNYIKDCQSILEEVVSADRTKNSSTTKTGRHDIAEILLKVALKHQK